MKTIEEKIAVMQAFKEGKKIQVRRKSVLDTDWHDTHDPSWDWWNKEYRVKPDIAPGHNPAKLTVEQVGEGYRLLTEHEMKTVVFLLVEGPSHWSEQDKEWYLGSASVVGRCSDYSYRTHLPEWYLKLPRSYRERVRARSEAPINLSLGGLTSAFSWKFTDEGRGFWYAVHCWLVGASWNLPPLPVPKTEAELWWEKLPESFPGCVRTEAAEGEGGDGKTLYIFFFSPSTNKVETFFTGYGYTKDEAIRSIRAQLDAAEVAEEKSKPSLNQMITELVGHEDLLSIHHAGAAWQATLTEYSGRNVADACGTAPEMAVKELWLRVVKDWGEANNPFLSPAGRPA